jgi:hypothetical protein
MPLRRVFLLHDVARQRLELERDMTAAAIGKALDAID